MAVLRMEFYPEFVGADSAAEGRACEITRVALRASSSTPLH